MIKKIYDLIIKNRITTIAGSIAFFLILNGGSFIFLFIIISSKFSNSFNELIIHNISDGKMRELIVYFFDYQNSIPYSFFLIITSVYSSSSLYYHFMSAVEILTKKEYRLSISKRLLAIIITILYLLIINFLAIILTELILFLDGHYKILSIVVLAILFLITLFIVHILVIKDYKFKKIYKGILFTIVYFVVFSIGFILYLRIFTNFKIVYGILSFFIILFFYIYVLCIGILLGIYVNYYKIDFQTLLNK